MAATSRKFEDPLAELGLRPQLGHDLPTLMHWLAERGLTITADILDRPADACLPGADALDNRAALAEPANRHASRPLTRQKLKDLKEHLKKDNLESNLEHLWAALRDGERIVRMLNWNMLPADAMAFYRPFTFRPLISGAYTC